MTWFATNLNRRDWDSLAWEWEKARIMEACGGQDMSELSLASEISINTSMQKTTVNCTHEHTFSSSLSHHELLYVKDAAIYNSEVSSGEIRPELLLDSMAQLFNLGHGPGGLHIVGHNQGNVRGHQGQAS